MLLHTRKRFRRWSRVRVSCVDTQQNVDLAGVEFVGGKLPSPTQNRVGFDDGGDLFQGSLAQLLADLS